MPSSFKKRLLGTYFFFYSDGRKKRNLILDALRRVNKCASHSSFGKETIMAGVAATEVYQISRRQGILN